MVQELQAVGAIDASTSEAGDASAGDAGTSLANITTVTDANCAVICRAYVGDANYVSCTAATDAGEPAAVCVVRPICG